MVAGGELDRENGIDLVPVMHAGGWKSPAWRSARPSRSIWRSRAWLGCMRWGQSAAEIYGSRTLVADHAVAAAEEDRASIDLSRPRDLGGKILQTRPREAFSRLARARSAAIISLVSSAASVSLILLAPLLLLAALAIKLTSRGPVLFLHSHRSGLRGQDDGRSIRR